jgi:hypothetical protein
MVLRTHDFPTNPRLINKNQPEADLDLHSHFQGASQHCVQVPPRRRPLLPSVRDDGVCDLCGICRKFVIRLKHSSEYHSSCFEIDGNPKTANSLEGFCHNRKKKQTRCQTSNLLPPGGQTKVRFSLVKLSCFKCCPQIADEQIKITTKENDSHLSISKKQQRVRSKTSS